MLSVSVKFDTKTLTRGLNGIQKKAIPKATKMALNRTAANVKSIAVKEVSKKTGLKSSLVRKHISITKAKNNQLTARVRATTGRLNLREFGARQTRKGVTAKIKGVKQIIHGAFIINGFAGGRVFKRSSKKRLPIKQATAPGVTWGFIQPLVDSVMKNTAKEKFKLHFRSRMNEELRRLGFSVRL